MKVRTNEWRRMARHKLKDPTRYNNIPPEVQVGQVLESTSPLLQTNRLNLSNPVMSIKSSFPVEAKVPECNAYEVLWNRHEQAECPDDLILYIEGASGEKRTYQEFRNRVVLVATALDRLLSGNAEMIAIISHNSSVRVRKILQH